MGIVLTGIDGVLLGDHQEMREFADDAGPLLLVAMQIVHVFRDQLATGVVPGAFADPIARIDGVRALSAQVRAPRTVPVPSGLCKGLTVRVGPRQAAEIATSVFPDACDEERHRWFLAG